VGEAAEVVGGGVEGARELVVVGGGAAELVVGGGAAELVVGDEVGETWTEVDVLDVDWSPGSEDVVELTS